MGKQRWGVSGFGGFLFFPFVHGAVSVEIQKVPFYAKGIEHKTPHCLWELGTTVLLSAGNPVFMWVSLPGCYAKSL